MKKTSAIFLAACACTSAAETVEGVLKKRVPYSALFSTSPESGNLIGYPIRNQSAASKTILANCLPSRFYKIVQGATRSMDNTEVLKFADRPSGCQGPGHGHHRVQLRKDSQNPLRRRERARRRQPLLLKGKPVVPTIEDNSSLNCVVHYEIVQSDVPLQDNGGTACPVLFRFITVSAVGLRATPEFGSCSNIIYPTWGSRTCSITVTKNGFRGPFEL